ncbi:uncharacterized protein LOC143211634 [Lasioglossum baleicum]|uniref:uncharacterized protein LOC143211634 n=1 Tax=Lasioglossum baleicum TaxID=434251 RepID=UPI003FCC9676
MEKDVIENFIDGLPDRISLKVSASQGDIKNLEDAYDAVLQIDKRLRNRRQSPRNESPSRWSRQESYDQDTIDIGTDARDHLVSRRKEKDEHPLGPYAIGAPLTPLPIVQIRQFRIVGIAVHPDMMENFVKIDHVVRVFDEIHEIRTTILHIHEAPAFFYVVKHLAIEADGLIGSPFLKQEEAEISYYHGTMVLRDKPTRPIRFSNYQLESEMPTKHRIDARSSQQISIRIANPKVKEGYLPRVKTHEKLYIGEAAVLNDKGKCHVMATNTSEEILDVEIEPQFIEPYDILDSSEEDCYSDIQRHCNFKTREDRIQGISESLQLSHLNEEERGSVTALIEEFPDIFYLPGDKLGKASNFKHSLHTTDEIPVNTRQYRYPPVHQEEIKKQINGLLSEGTITPSNSPYNSPLWIVPKKPDAQGNKRWRMVIDFRALNEKTISDKYPLPQITEILDRLGGAKYFSIFDLASGFHQIEMDPKDRQKTAFTTPNGHYEFSRMPFGLKNAPPTFQRLMDQVLTGLQGTDVFIYLDDVVVHASSLHEHNIKVRKLLNRLREHGLTLQTNKCEFLRKEVAYLGHIISRQGVRPDPRKLKAVKEFPMPKSQKNIQQFLGLVGYYRRFVPDFTTKAKSLIDLLGKGKKFKWAEEQENSFKQLRDELCREPILQFPDFNKPFIITTDASEYAIGAVLSQGEIGSDLPIAYASRSLNKAERNYSATEKECLAMVYAVIYFRPYVYGTKFTLVTDHRPLVWLHSVKDPTSRLMKWKLRLLEYDYQVVHKSGKINKNADALSRNPVSMCLPLIPREFKDPEFKIPVPKSVVDTNTIGQRIKQLRRDREKRPKYQDTSSSDEIGEPTLGKVQHSPIINRNRSLPSLSREVTMPDENQDTPHHFLPAANSTDIFSTEKDTSLSGDLISFDTPLENTVIENTNNLQGDSPNVPQILFPETGGLLQPTVIGFPNNTVREASVRQPSDHTAEPYPFFDSSTDGSSTETDLEAPPEPKKGISISSDTLTAGEDHYVHFVSVDCNLITPVGKLLLDTGSINKQELLAARAKKGQVVVSNNGLFKTFSIVISDNFYDKPKRIDIVNGLNTLRSTLEENRSKSFRISATGDHHGLSANELFRTLKEAFVDSFYRITICNCVITTPSLENRQEIIQEAHDSLIGGHKGATKTYNRVRSRFHWPHMRNEIQDYIRKCKSCQEQKLVRTKTRQPMLIADTPLDAFDKISLDTVGPLPITPGGCQNDHPSTLSTCEGGKSCKGQRYDDQRDKAFTSRA